MAALLEQEPDHDQSAQSRKIEHAAIEARLRALHVRARKNNATVPASHFCCGANKGGKADHQQHRPARRNAEKSVQGETEINKREYRNWNHIEKLGFLRREQMEREASDADQGNESDKEEMVRGLLLAGAPLEELKPHKGGKNEGDVADRIDGLGAQRRARALLAIEEDVFAECHAARSHSAATPGKSLGRRRFHPRSIIAYYVSPLIREAKRHPAEAHPGPVPPRQAPCLLPSAPRRCPHRQEGRGFSCRRPHSFHWRSTGPRASERPRRRHPGVRPCASWSGIRRPSA